MKFSENWLRALVDPPFGGAALDHALTMAGLEVEAVETLGAEFDGVVVGEVLEAEPHPNADRLQVCRVAVGEAEPLHIVCGAPNVTRGMKAPCARVGARLPGGVSIQAAKVRGVVSEGMLCSASELGLGSEGDGLLALPADTRPGTSLRTVWDLPDRLLTLKLTPNRGDCLSLLGVAREVAALTEAPLRWVPPEPVPGGATRLPVAVEAPEACPRYCGRIIRGLRADAATPPWMARRLERSGLRCIHPVVDITNYVMLEIGQPLHAFDLAKIHGGIRVRFAFPGERLALLNNQELDLTPDLLVIADESVPVALAGIMGGAATGVADGTRDVFLESAFFSPSAIAGKSRRLGLASDAAYRFERGVDFAATRLALERASQLMLEVCGGVPGEISEVGERLPPRPPVRLRLARVSRVLGLDFEEEQAADLLRRLEVGFARESGIFHVTPPSHRFDLQIEEDFIEELARLHGYDRIPATFPKADLRILPEPEGVRGDAWVRDFLTVRGYQEVVTYSFVDRQWERDLAGNDAPIALLNPIAAQMGVMRSSLMGSLVECLRHNVHRQQSRVRLFEIGRCFHHGPEGYLQPERIAGLCYGPVAPAQWGAPPRPADFYDVKGDVDGLLRQAQVSFEPAAYPALHPGRCARIASAGRDIGWLGELHPQWVQKYELSHSPVLFELDLEAVRGVAMPSFAEPSKFPVVQRDFAVVVDESIPAQALLKALRSHAPESVSEIRLFDVYRGKGIEYTKKSLAFRLVMQDTRKTLTDEEVDAIVGGLTAVLENQHGAKLRA